MNKNERYFWLDWTMFISFSITIASGILLWLVIPRAGAQVFAGIERAGWLALHAGFGLLGLAGVILHVVWHWDWLKALRGRSLRTLKRPVRANRIINRMTWFSFISANVFALMAWLLSAWMSAGAINIFVRLHVVTGMAWLVFLATHLLLHQKWIVLASRRFSPLGLANSVKWKKEC